MATRLSIVIEYQPGVPLPAFNANTEALGGRVVAFAIGDSLIDPNAGKRDLMLLVRGLSARETQVAEMMVDGIKPNEMAKRLGINAKTVHRYRYRIHEHLGVRSDVQAVKILMAAGDGN